MNEVGAFLAPTDIDVGAATQAMLAAVEDTVAKATSLIGLTNLLLFDPDLVE